MSVTPVAQRTTWQLDTGYTNVEFSIKKFMITNVKGRFADFSGTIVVDEARPEASSVAVEVDVASLNSRDEKRDAHLKSAEFFDVETYPKISFQSTNVERLSDEQLRVTGNLTIRDTTRVVTLDTAFHGTNHTPWGNEVAAFSAETSISRADYGLIWNMPLEKGGVLVGDTVKISLEIQAVKQV